MPAPRILLAWELGGGLGHLAPLKVLARHLQQRGWQCEWAVRNLDTAARYLTADGSPLPLLHQAPLAQQAPQFPLAVQLNYASTLFSCGYDDAAALAARLAAWCALIRRSGCTQVLADHAPTALLAARCLGIRAAAIGTGFSLPPLHAPFPSYWPDADVAVLRANEEKVLSVINTALATLRAPALPSLQALFEGVEQGLFTYAETDRYGSHPARTTAYRGLHDLSAGARVQWPEGRSPRVLALLDRSPGTAEMLSALAATPCSVLVKLRDLDPSQFAALHRKGWLLTREALWLRQALESCDVFVGHGAHGSAVECLLAGKPQLLLPDQRERQLLSQRVTALGAGIELAVTDAATYRKALDQLLADPAPRAAAAAFASRYQGQDRRRILPDWGDAALSLP